MEPFFVNLCDVVQKRNIIEKEHDVGNRNALPRKVSLLAAAKAYSHSDLPMPMMWDQDPSNTPKNCLLVFLQILAIGFHPTTSNLTRVPPNIK